MPHRMMRREFALAAGAGAFGPSGVGWPVWAGEGKSLYFIVRNDLRVLEAIWATAYVTRNRGYWDSTRSSCSTPVIITPAIFMWNVEKGRGARGFPDDFEQPEKRDGSRDDAPRIRCNCGRACRPWIWRQGRRRRY